MKFLIILLTVISCAREVHEFTATEKEYLKSLTIEERAYMEACMTRRYEYDTAYCMGMMKMALAPRPKVITQNVSSGESTTSTIVKTAVGTAIGYGAVKLLTGKRK